MYRVKFEPFGEIQQAGGTIVFHKLRGKADVWLDCKQLGTKSEQNEADLSLSFPPGEGSRSLTVVIEASSSGQMAGFNGPVTIQSKPVMER
jgi:beta-galactosidase